MSLALLFDDEARLCLHQYGIGVSDVNGDNERLRADGLQVREIDVRLLTAT